MGQPDQSVGLLVQGFVGRPVGDDHAVAQGLEVALQVRQRGPQLVRGVGDEIAAHLLLLLERRGHLVERVREAGELLRSLARDARRVVAVGDATGRATDLRQRPREHAREHDRQAHAREHGDHRRGDHDGRH